MCVFAHFGTFRIEWKQKHNVWYFYDQNLWSCHRPQPLICGAHHHLKLPLLTSPVIFDLSDSTTRGLNIICYCRFYAVELTTYILSGENVSCLPMTSEDAINIARVAATVKRFDKQVKKLDLWQVHPIRVRKCKFQLLFENYDRLTDQQTNRGGQTGS